MFSPSEAKRAVAEPAAAVADLHSIVVSFIRVRLRTHQISHSDRDSAGEAEAGAR
jgi:hypothetical protein